MSSHPVVAKVPAIRDKLTAKCGYDIQKILRRIRQPQADSGLEYVRYPPRRLMPPDHTAA